MAVITYCVIGPPPSSAGRFHVKSTSLFAKTVAAHSDGAPGFFVATRALELDELKDTVLTREDKLDELVGGRELLELELSPRLD